MADPLTPRHPLRIEPGLDRAAVRILVEPPERSPRRRQLAGGVGTLVVLLGFLAAPGPLAWLMAGFVLLVLLATVLPPSNLPYELTFEADRGGPIFQGRRVEGTADYLSLTLDGQRYVIPKGLTRGEHARLSKLLEPGAQGSHQDVPAELQHLSD